MNFQLTQHSDFKQLVEVCSDNEQVALFFIEWMTNGFDAKAAYKKLHPNVTEGSAKTLGSRWLTRVDRQSVLAAYNLGLERYLKQLDAGLEAQRWNQFTKEREPDHKTRFPYFEILGRLLGFENEKRTLVDTNVHVNLERPIIYIPKKKNE